MRLTFPSKTVGPLPDWIHIRLDLYAEYRGISSEEAHQELTDSEYATQLDVPGWWCLNATNEKE